jgi:hypothetical protein
MKPDSASKLAEYRVWAGMKRRCLNKNDASYKNYGGRGITICARWLVFENFYKDLGPRPSPIHSIERKDVNGNYQPENVIWAGPDVQARNKRNNRWVTYQGETLCLADWFVKLNISDTEKRREIGKKLWAGWTMKNALTLDWLDVDLCTQLNLNLREDLSLADEQRLQQALQQQQKREDLQPLYDYLTVEIKKLQLEFPGKTWTFKTSATT